MHSVLTKDYQENKRHGLMICGINFSYSEKDRKSHKNNPAQQVEEKSYFSDSIVNESLFRNRAVHAFSLWGGSLDTTEDKISSFEQAIFQTNWLNTQTNDVDGIKWQQLVGSSDGIIKLICTSSDLI